jgi:hypothetical protein
MRSNFIGLSLAVAATAQIVNGLSSVPITTGTSSSAQYAVTPTPSAMTASSVPAQPSGGAAAAQYTAPPAPGQDFYQYMSYNSMTSGGYKQLQCGYGYQKQADGTCAPLSWVSV